MKTITFSGHQWDVRASKTGGPGPNNFDDGNAQVDDNGQLHLRITSPTNAEGDTEWHCVEIGTQLRFGFGRYQFDLNSRVDKLDPNVVLGLFTHPTSDVGVDGTNEIDIEFAQWGNAAAKNADNVVYPAFGPRVNNTTQRDNFEFIVKLNGDFSAYQFLWESDRVTFQSFHGHHYDNAHEFERWQYKPDQARLIPQQAVPLHMNLWLFKGRPPIDNAEVEIVIGRFGFTALDQLV